MLFFFEGFILLFENSLSQMGTFFGDRRFTCAL